MARTPDISVRIRADGVTQVRNAFKAVRAEAQRAFSRINASARQMRATLDAVAKPVRIAVSGAADIARVTAGVAALAGALAGLEASKELDAGQSVEGMKAGIRVAVDNTQELTKQLSAAKAEYASLGNSSNRFGEVAGRIKMIESQLADQRDTSKLVDDQWQRIVGTATELGVEISKVGPAFVGLANATKGTSAAGETTERTFRGMLMAGSALNRSNEEIEGSLLALQQIASKGRVSMEELSGQLGERLPGALNIAARAFGVTTGELRRMVENEGVDSALFLEKFSRQLETEFAPAAERAAKRPAASFARLKNSIFLARAEVSNGGLAGGLARISDRLTVLVDRLSADGSFTRLGERIGAGLDKLPGIMARVSAEFAWLRMQAAEWWRQMGVALGLDFDSFGNRATAGLAKVRGFLLQLAFDIPGLIFAMRQAFAGDGEDVSARYAWVVPLVAFIRDQVMPVIAQIPGIIETWWPAFQAAGSFILSTMESIRNAFYSVFGEETGRKILAFLVIAKVTGALSAFAGALGVVMTAIRAVVALFKVLRLGMILLFTPPGGLIVAAIAAIVALAYVIYQNWDAIAAFVGRVWDGIKAGAQAFIDGIASIWNGLGDLLSGPFELAKKVIKSILEAIMKMVEYSPAGLLFKAGKFVLEQVMGESSHDGAKGYRTGGVLRGPGSGTSDSIPWWGSNGEGVINSRAVQHYGGGSFVDGINSLSLPMRAPADVVEVASGGGRPFSLVMPGVGAATGPVSDEFAAGVQKLFDRAQAGRARQKKPRGAR